MKTNVLYYGDNLDILRKYIPDESVDLIYLDPPFNSKKDYNILFKESGGLESEAQIHAFTDSWHWTQATQDTYQEIITKSPQKVALLIDSLHTAIGQNDVMAYLVMMTIRLQELHRVLKPTGSLYLHCDPSASHYLKIAWTRYSDQATSGTRLCGKGLQRTMTRGDMEPILTDFYSTQKVAFGFGTRFS
jgi:site-specific DNA-methyltransferase (adenine-specific)